MKNLSLFQKVLFWCVVALFLLLILAGGLVGIGYWGWQHVRTHSTELLRDFLEERQIPARVAAVTWVDQGAVELVDVDLGEGGNALRIDKLTVTWSWLDLLKHRRIAAVTIHDLEIWTGALDTVVKQLSRTFAEAAVAADSGPPWIIERVEVHRVLVNFDNLRPGLRNIPISLAREEPLVFTQVPLGSAEFLEQDRVQRAAIRNLLITSPYDPITRVLSFEQINLTFSWRGLLQQRLQQVEVVAPAVYLGPDLFWFADELRKMAPGEENPNLAVDQPSWMVDKFTLRGGQLVISAFGDPGVTLPFLFNSETQDLNLSRLQELSLRNTIQIAAQSITYPSYNITLDINEGDIRFNLPPDADNARNLVPRISLKTVRWRDLEAKKVWTTFTFDGKGIYAKLGGEVYSGYFNGEFVVSFKPGYPWQAWAYLTDVDAEPIVQRLTRDRFDVELTGRATGRLEVEARSTTITKTTARLSLKPPGELHIGELDRYIKELPSDWGQVQRVLATALHDAFRSYPYTAAQLQLDYQQPLSTARLLLQGPKGNRTLKLNWTQDPTRTPLATHPHLSIN